MPKISEPWVSGENSSLLTDLYQLTMMQVYVETGMTETAVFDLYVRSLPKTRNLLIACGLEDALQFLENVCFSDEQLHYLASLQLFSKDFLDYLANFKFSGDVWAVREGTPVFGYEPILQVEAPLPEAQLIETFLLNQINFQTGVASKAFRVIRAANNRTVVDFGLRRTHGTDAAMKASRASWISGAAGTSNVLAGQIYGIPVFGTMAHSFIEAHENELAAFEAFADLYPHTTLLIDTYDTIEGVKNVVRLAAKMGDRFTVRALRLDSGDLDKLGRACRNILDEAGLNHVRLFASGNLDEYRIDDLVQKGSPIDGFGVGTAMGSLADAPFLNSVYKLSLYNGVGRMKFSADKASYPGRKQIFRQVVDGKMVADTIALRDEAISGEPLLRPVMKSGERLAESFVSLSEIRSFVSDVASTLPPANLSIKANATAYPVSLSPELEVFTRDVRSSIELGRKS